MAQYNVTDEVQRLLDAGMTVEQITAKTRRGLDRDGDRWIVWNGGDQGVIASLVYDRVTYPAEQAAARQARPAARREDKATERQVDYILSLLARRSRSGEEGGFMAGPTTREEIAKMTKAQASAYITSLKGAY